TVSPPSVASPTLRRRLPLLKVAGGVKATVPARRGASHPPRLGDQPRQVSLAAADNRGHDDLRQLVRVVRLDELHQGLGTIGRGLQRHPPLTLAADLAVPVEDAGHRADDLSARREPGSYSGGGQLLRGRLAVGRRL